MVATQLLVALPVSAAPGNNNGGQARAAGGQTKSAARPASQPQANKTGGGYANKGTAKPDYGAKPAYAGQADKSARPSTGAKPNYTAQGDKARPAGNYNAGNTQPGNDNGYNRPGATNNVNVNKGGNKNNVNVNNNNVNIINNVNINNVNRYPVYRPPGGGYYRPPNGGYYGPPRPPYGGWHGGYYPPPRYYYNDGPSVGGVLFGVAVTTSLLALLSAASQPDVVIVQGAPPPPLPAYVPPPKASGAPALINVDINAMPAAARPSASTCLTEAARQIGATGGSEIRVGEIIDVEQGNGGYRFRLMLVGVYPDATRNIPMYCRATPDKIVELTFG
jgi:hypothetical protein